HQRQECPRHAAMASGAMENTTNSSSVKRTNRASSIASLPTCQMPQAITLLPAKATRNRRRGCRWMRCMFLLLLLTLSSSYDPYGCRFQFLPDDEEERGVVGNRLSRSGCQSVPFALS